MGDALFKAVALRNAVLAAWVEEHRLPLKAEWEVSQIRDHAFLTLRCEKCFETYKGIADRQTRFIPVGTRKALKGVAAMFARVERDAARHFWRGFSCRHLYSFIRNPTYHERRMTARVGLVLLEGAVFGSGS